MYVNRKTTRKFSDKLNYNKIIAFCTVHTQVLNYWLTYLIEKKAKKNKNYTVEVSINSLGRKILEHVFLVFHWMVALVCLTANILF